MKVRRVALAGPSTWPGRILAAVAGIALGLLAVLFFAAFAVIAAALAIVGLVRLWWLGRRGPSAPVAEGIVVEYTVEQNVVSPAPELPPTSPHEH